MSFDELYEKLRNYWLMQKVEPGTGASEAEIAAFESTYQIILPDDVRNYFLKVNGMKESGDCDNEMITFYALQDVKPLSIEMSNHKIENAESYFVFADYCIWCWGYAIQLSDSSAKSTPVFRIDDELIKIAYSFSEFMERYINGDKDIIYSTMPIDGEIKKISLKPTPEENRGCFEKMFSWLKG